MLIYVQLVPFQHGLQNANSTTKWSICNGNEGAQNYLMNKNRFTDTPDAIISDLAARGMRGRQNNLEQSGNFINVIDMCSM